MLPGLRTLLVATLTAIVVAFALLSQLHSHLPNGGNARARATPLRPADANHMPLLVSQASARRHEELHRLMSIASESERNAVAIDSAPIQIAALPPAPAIEPPRAAEPIVIPRAEIVALVLGASAGETIAMTAELSIGPLASLTPTNAPTPDSEIVEPIESTSAGASVLAVIPEASAPMITSEDPPRIARKVVWPRARPLAADASRVSAAKAAQQAAARQKAKAAALAALAAKKRLAAAAKIAAKKKSAARAARAARAPAAAPQNSAFPFSF